MFEFSSLPSLLSQFQLPPAPESPTTIWVALEATGWNWGTVIEAISAGATFLLALFAACQLYQTNKIIDSANKQANELREQNDILSKQVKIAGEQTEGLRKQNEILSAQLESERTLRYPTLVATKNYFEQISNKLELVNVSQNDILVFGARVFPNLKQLMEPQQPDLFEQIRDGDNKIEAIHPAIKAPEGFYTVPPHARVIVKVDKKNYPSDNEAFLALATTYPSLGPVTLVLPLTCKKENGNTCEAIMLANGRKLEPLETLLRRHAKPTATTEDQP